MWHKATYYHSASVAALIVGSLWAVSKGASAATVEITSDVAVTNAPLTAVATPVTDSGNFQQSVTGGDTPVNGIGSGGRLSPYAFNSDGLATTGAYSVLGAGPDPPNVPAGSATYNINAPGVELLWGSPDSYNQATFFSTPNGMGTSIGSFTGQDIGPLPGASGSESSLVTFFATSGDIGSVTLSNSGSAAFEFGGPDPVPLPPAIYLFGSALGGAFWLGRRKRSAVSGLD
jgi:hypothetical protein